MDHKVLFWNCCQPKFGCPMDTQGTKWTEPSEFRGERGLMQGLSKEYRLIVLKRPELHDSRSLGRSVFKDKI